MPDKTLPPFPWTLRKLAAGRGWFIPFGMKGRKKKLKWFFLPTGKIQLPDKKKRMPGCSTSEWKIFVVVVGTIRWIVFKNYRIYWKCVGYGFAQEKNLLLIHIIEFPQVVKRRQFPKARLGYNKHRKIRNLMPTRVLCLKTSNRTSNRPNIAQRKFETLGYEKKESGKQKMKETFSAGAGDQGINVRLLL